MTLTEGKQATIRGALRFLTSQKTAVLSAVSGMTLLVADQAVQDELRTLGMSETTAARLVSAAKLLSIVLAYLGFSPLKRPA